MDKGDDKVVTILGRKLVWHEGGIRYEADEKHREILLDYFGFKRDSRGLGVNGDKEDKEEEGEDEEVGREEATIFRGLAARLNFLSLDCPDLQFPVKDCSREMSHPTRGALGD